MSLQQRTLSRLGSYSTVSAYDRESGRRHVGNPLCIKCTKRYGRQQSMAWMDQVPACSL
jgi:hypothetical protein